MPLYKYMMKKHLEAFVAKGSLRIGTLYEYRDTEAHNAAVGDAEEGKYSTEFSISGGGKVDLNSDSREAIFLRSIIPGLENLDVPITYSFGPNAGIISAAEAPQLFIYCTTATYDEAAMKKFGYDACLEIVDPDAFFSAVSRVIRHKAIFMQHAPITYAAKRTNWTRPHPVPPWMMKSPEFKYQREVRAIWRPARSRVDPIFVDVPKAIRHCRVFTGQR